MNDVVFHNAGIRWVSLLFSTFGFMMNLVTADNLLGLFTVAGSDANRLSEGIVCRPWRFKAFRTIRGKKKKKRLLQLKYCRNNNGGKKTNVLLCLLPTWPKLLLLLLLYGSLSCLSCVGIWMGAGVSASCVYCICCSSVQWCILNVPSRPIFCASSKDQLRAWRPCWEWAHQSWCIMRCYLLCVMR